MTVKELIEKLSKLPPEQDVMLSYEYGDHVHTEVAADIVSVNQAAVSWSGYHEMYKLDEEGDTVAVVISA